jgi:hypothetical protein
MSDAFPEIPSVISDILIRQPAFDATWFVVAYPNLPKQVQMMFRVLLQLPTLAGFAVILSVGCGLAWFINQKSEADHAAAVSNYREKSLQETKATATKVEESLKLIYQGIRTISQLPSVQSVDRHGTNLDANAHAAIEQIYKNMISNVAVSEIYIVPADLDPEKIDPVTGELQVPALMYDGSEEEPAGAEAPHSPITTVAQAEKVDEVEIFEYRQLQQHPAPPRPLPPLPPPLPLLLVGTVFFGATLVFFVGVTFFVGAFLFTGVFGVIFFTGLLETPRFVGAPPFVVGALPLVSPLFVGRVFVFGFGTFFFVGGNLVLVGATFLLGGTFGVYAQATPSV